MAKSFKIEVLIRLIYIFQWLLYLTCRKEFHIEYEYEKNEKGLILLFWHGKLALMPFIFLHCKKNFKKAYVIISQHKDGEIIARNIKLFGIDSIRGSSTRGFAHVLRKSFEVLDNGSYLAITPDGPRGPYHYISDGCVSIAQKKNVDLAILNYEVSRYWQLSSWDKMIIPKPFSRIRYRFSKAFSLKNLDKNEAKRIISEKFDIITKVDSFSKDKDVVSI